MQEFETYTLPNGIKGIHRRVRSSVTHCALVVNAGTRDEQSHEYGLAHFAEHAIFKGTKRRKAYQINCRLENRGGELNAYTTKEDTTIHATTLRSDFSKAVELIADVAFCSTFPEHELQKEREVIVDEINTYKDSPADMIFDTFEDLIFAGSELGHNILGTKAALMRHTSESIKRFVERTHTTDQMVFSSIGNMSVKSVQSIAAKYLAEQPSTKRDFKRITPVSVEPFERVVNKHTHQTHCIIGARAYDINDEKRLPLSLLVNILGGPSANSRLNTVLREKNGLSYNTEAVYTPYNDCGMVAIYFSSDHHNADLCRELIDKELRALRTTPPTARRMAMIKRQFLAQMAISMENNEGYMLGAGKSYLVHDEIDTLEEVYRKVSAVTAEQITEVAEEIFANTSTLIYQ
ncbi:MAG: insulinase family protein [Alistipes sp.]|nr:insulinase family protein [Alistipes sp.]MBQ5898556.1 insulinase family protein [Alistipes sp.]